MSYVETHRTECRRVLKRAQEYLDFSGVGRTYFCRLAGAQIHALTVLERATATPKTVAAIDGYLDRIHKEEAGALVDALTLHLATVGGPRSEVEPLIAEIVGCAEFASSVLNGFVTDWEKVKQLHDFLRPTPAEGDAA